MSNNWAIDLTLNDVPKASQHLRDIPPGEIFEGVVVLPEHQGIAPTNRAQLYLRLYSASTVVNLTTLCYAICQDALVYHYKRVGRLQATAITP